MSVCVMVFYGLDSEQGIFGSKLKKSLGQEFKFYCPHDDKI